MQVQAINQQPGTTRNNMQKYNIPVNTASKVNSNSSPSFQSWTEWNPLPKIIVDIFGFIIALPAFIVGAAKSSADAANDHD